MAASRVDRAFERFRAGGDPRALAFVFDATANELYHTIEVKEQDGRTATTTADIAASDPPVVVDLPLP